MLVLATAERGRSEAQMIQCSKKKNQRMVKVNLFKKNFYFNFRWILWLFGSEERKVPALLNVWRTLFPIAINFWPSKWNNVMPLFNKEKLCTTSYLTLFRSIDLLWHYEHSWCSRSHPCTALDPSPKYLSWKEQAC